MIIYRLEFTDRPCDGGNGGATYHGTFKDARLSKKAAIGNGYTVEISKIKLRCTKAEVLRVLNRYGGHPDNG